MRMERSWGIRRGIGVVGAVSVLWCSLLGSAVEAAQWSRKEINRLPDSAFAVIERTESGKAIRRLPHHDAGGRLDIPHLCNAWARLTQVKWHAAANAEIARRHLEAHLAEAGKGACRAPRGK